ncbi:addiction module protein [Nostoc sp.]|uniref:addiction module protein n=1 Tax=Nostoc sp. TaxID=1180 RepID=UPI002FF5963E
MSETAEKLKLELSQLSAKERAEIAYFLIHSLDEGIDDNLETAWDVELTQRLEDINRKTAIRHLRKMSIPFYDWLSTGDR